MYADPSFSQNMPSLNSNTRHYPLIIRIHHTTQLFIIQNGIGNVSTYPSNYCFYFFSIRQIIIKRPALDPPDQGYQLL